MKRIVKCVALLLIVSAGLAAWLSVSEAQEGDEWLSSVSRQIDDDLLKLFISLNEMTISGWNKDFSYRGATDWSLNNAKSSVKILVGMKKNALLLCKSFGKPRSKADKAAFDHLYKSVIGQEDPISQAHMKAMVKKWRDHYREKHQLETKIRGILLPELEKIK